jgi:hypothetical protein
MAVVAGDPFISTTDLSNILGRDVTGDDAATAAVDAACMMCRTEAEQSFDLVAGDQVTLDGSGTDCLLLPELPVSAAGTVITNGVLLTENQDYALASNGRLIRTGGTAYTMFPVSVAGAPLGRFGGYAGGPVWPAGRQNVQVTYDHGGTAIPTDVRMVALQIAQRIVVQGVAVYETLATGQQIRYAGPALDLSAGEKAILRRYKQIR